MESFYSTVLVASFNSQFVWENKIEQGYYVEDGDMAAISTSKNKDDPFQGGLL